jgi:hypothetical protein
MLVPFLKKKKKKLGWSPIKGNFHFTVALVEDGLKCDSVPNLFYFHFHFTHRILAAKMAASSLLRSTATATATASLIEASPSPSDRFPKVLLLPYFSASSSSSTICFHQLLCVLFRFDSAFAFLNKLSTSLWK